MSCSKCGRSRVSRLRVGSSQLSPPALALFAALPDVIVRADAAATAVLAAAPLAVMLADARAPAVLADAPLAIMLADARAPAVLAVGGGRATHRLLKVHGLHLGPRVSTCMCAMYETTRKSEEIVALGGKEIILLTSRGVHGLIFPLDLLLSPANLLCRRRNLSLSSTNLDKFMRKVGSPPCCLASSLAQLAIRPVST